MRWYVFGSGDPSLRSSNATGHQPNREYKNRCSFLGVSGGTDGEGVHYGLISAEKHNLEQFLRGVDD